MPTIDHKFRIGQTVFRPQVSQEKVAKTCPDCLGTKVWGAKLPNGEEMKIACPTCDIAWGSSGNIYEYEVAGYVQTLTIGSVRIDTNAKDSSRRVSYMCEETGVGSGSVHYEPDLFENKKEAEDNLPFCIEKQHILQQENIARSRTNRKKPAQMIGYFRQQIMSAKKEIKNAEEGIAREQAKENLDVDKG